MMIRQSAPYLIGICLITTTGCNSAYEENRAAADRMIAIMEDLTGTLNSIEDEASAKAAVPKIDDISDRLKELTEDIQDLPKLTEEDDEKLEAEMGSKSDPLKGKLQSGMFKALAFSAKVPELEEAMERLQAALTEFGEVAGRLAGES